MGGSLKLENSSLHEVEMKADFFNYMDRNNIA
jgi:hypothetical protein